MKILYTNALKLMKPGLRLVLAGTLLWLLIWALKGDQLAYLGYINAAGFGVLVLMLVVFLLSLFRKLWVEAAIALIVACWLFVTSSGLHFAAGEDRASENSIRIVTASLRGANKDMHSAAIQLSRYQPEIIALQEVSDAAAFKRALDAASDSQWHMASVNNLAILSRTKISKGPDAFAGWLTVETQIAGKAMTVWTLRAPKAFDQPVDNEIFFRRLAKSVAAQKPDIVLGDFNATPWNNGYAKIHALMQDAQKTAGLGPGNTFPAPARRSGLFGAFARIDHIFVDDGIDISNAFTGQASRGADHHPVIADIRKP